MDPALMDYLACPGCACALQGDFAERENGRVVAGTLRCIGCSKTYPIVRGIPRMNVSMEGFENVARTFDYEWKAYREGKFEGDTLFGRSIAECWRYFVDSLMIDPSRVRDAIVLDAGCGPGLFTRSVAEQGAKMVIGLDINEAVDVASENCRELENVQMIQANILALPFKKERFDLVWCSGVLQYTPDPAQGHSCLARLVKPGGVLFVWVYAKRFSPFRFTRDVLNFLRVTRLSPRYLMLLSNALAYMSLGLLWIYRRIRTVPGLRPGSARWSRTVRPRTVGELYLRWFDTLSPEHESRHTEEEVIGWFRRAGFGQIRAIDEPKVGVRGVASVETPYPG